MRPPLSGIDCRKVYAPENGRVPPAALFTEYQQPVVRRHCVIGVEGERIVSCQVAHISKLTDPAARVLRAQGSVEPGIGIRRVTRVVHERPIHAEHSVFVQHPGNAAEHVLHARPGHDMQCVCGECRSEALCRPRTLVYIQMQRRQDVGQRSFVEPVPDARMIFPQIGCLPHEVRQSRAKVDGVLSGAAADLENGFGFLQQGNEQLRDWLTVARASGGKRFA